MDEFLRCLTEQACGNVYKKKRLVLEQGGPAFQTDPMGGAPVGGSDPTANMAGQDVDQGMGGNGMDMGTDDDMGGPMSQGVQLTGEQVAMLNQDLQGIMQAMQRIQSVLGGEIAPMSGGDEMGGDQMMGDEMGGDMGMNMGGGMGGGAPMPPANMMARYSRKFMGKR